MPFTQFADFFLNTEGEQYPAQFWTSRTNNNAKSIQFVQGDKILLRLWLCSPASEYRQPAVLQRANGPIVFAIYDKVGSTNLLAIADSFTLVDDSPDATAPHYEATLDLNTTQLLAALTGNTPSLDARLDIELESPGNAERYTFTRPITLIRQSYTGGQPAPTTPPADYPPPGDIPSWVSIQNLIAAAVTAQAPGLIAAAVQAAVATAVATIPRPTRSTTATLDPSSPATVEIITPDPDNPTVPGSQLFAFGIPKGAPGAVTATPADFTTGTVPIPSGATSITITFPIPYATLPKVFPSVFAPANAPGEIFATAITSLTTTSFTAALAAPAPVSGFTLSYIAFATPE